MKHIPLVIAAVLVPGLSLAQSKVDMTRTALLSLQGTISVSHQPQMAEGKLTGCSMNFEHMQQDFVYLNGNFIRSSGSVALMSAGANIAVVMKIVAGELNPADEPMNARPLKVSRVYLLGHDMSSNFENLLDSYPSEDGGGLLSVYPPDPSLEMVLGELQTGAITVAVGLGGAMDIQLPIDITTASRDDKGKPIHSPDALLAFFGCGEKLLESLAR